MSKYDFSDWHDLLARIRHRPGMWLGEPSLTALQHLISGIQLAEDIHDIPEQKRIGGFSWAEFEAWADKRYNPNRLSIRSFGMAHRATDCESGAFNLWFEWYDQFNRERNPP